MIKTYKTGSNETSRALFPLSRVRERAGVRASGANI
jgi:hypothetical protein